MFLNKRSNKICDCEIKTEPYKLICLNKKISEYYATRFMPEQPNITSLNQCLIKLNNENDNPLMLVAETRIAQRFYENLQSTHPSLVGKLITPEYYKISFY